MITLALTATLLCQAEPNSAETLQSSLNFHYYQQFNSSITGGGDIKMTSAGAELRLISDITNSDEIEFRFQFQRDDYDFSGNTGFGSLDAWGEVQTIDFTTVWTHEYDQQNRWYFGGIVRAAYEESASANVQGGGTVAFAHSFSSDLTIGGGVGVIGQANDDPRAFPIIILDWKLTDKLRLSSDLSTRFGSRTGLELIWTPRDDWSFGVGYSYSYSRFRLDGSGFAPDGAGEASSYPLTFRATYTASPAFSLTFFGGIVFDGHLEVTNNNRALMQSVDYDNAGVIGLFGKILVYNCSLL